MIKVLIANDQRLVRESLELVLSSYKDLKMLGSAGDEQELLERIRFELPDVILMDINLSRSGGDLCIKTVKEFYPQIKIVILTASDDDASIFNALKCGASGYLLTKGTSMDDLHSALVDVNQGMSPLNPYIASRVFKLFYKMAQSDVVVEADKSAIDQITDGEWLIIEHVGLGLSNREIAGKLFLSEGTIRNYLSSVLAKLNLRDRTQLAIWAVQSGVTLKVSGA
ncbi:response regulator transcription factor [Streptococcaceae bacterium ESL0687]|nr:response regulator transcription factor [Streptococcaceae bacterium ESL0687]